MPMNRAPAHLTKLGESDPDFFVLEDSDKSSETEASKIDKDSDKKDQDSSIKTKFELLEIDKADMVMVP